MNEEHETQEKRWLFTLTCDFSTISRSFSSRLIFRLKKIRWNYFLIILVKQYFGFTAKPTSFFNQSRIPRKLLTSQQYFKSPFSTLYPIETPTCQAGQFLRPNGEDGVRFSCLLKFSYFEPAVSMILKNLVSKRTWSLIIIGQTHRMPISFSRLNAC